MEQAHALRRALLSAREEGLIMLALWVSCFGVAITGNQFLGCHGLIVVLMILSIPYLAAVLVSLQRIQPSAQ